MRSQEELNAMIREYRSAESTADLPLRDVRVIDMATVMAAPFAATLLGDFGAEVIKVENPNMPDAIRGWGVTDSGIQPFIAVVGRNKYPVTVNLKSPKGKEILLKLVEQADVLIENMRPGTMEKLGLAADILLERNPGLVISKVSGYGQTGPYAPKPGFGTLAEGLSGYTYLNAQPGGTPTNPPLALADFVAGLHLAFGIMIALRSQERGKGGGQVIDMSLYEPLFGLLSPDFLTYDLTGVVPQPQGNELTYVAPRNNYQTRDGKWVALSGSAQKPFERLMEAMGRPEMNQDPRFATNEARIKSENRQIINQVISDWIGSMDAEDVLATCDRLGITVGPITTMEDIANNPQYQERQSWVEVEDAATRTPLKLPNVSFRLLGSAGRVRFAGLPQGAANEVIYQELLGYPPEDVRQFKEAGAI